MSKILKIGKTNKGLFDPKNFFKISDKTMVFPFFNSKDAMSDLPFGLCDEFSMTAGIIEAGVQSKLHAHPHIAQLTFVMNGSITMNVKEPDKKPYSLTLQKYEATLSPKGSIIQFDNSNNEQDCEVLYIVGPPYLYLVEDEGKKVLYEDAIILEETWEELKANDWKPSVAFPSTDERLKAFDELEKISL